jgi:hypothetical protein
MSIFDINGVLNVQSQYLHDLGNSNTNGGTATAGIQNLQTYLNTLKEAIASSGASTADILTKQSTVNQIVTDEASRLDKKKQQIDAKTFMSQRMAQLNDNYKNRQAYINKIFIIVVIGLLIFIGLIKLKNWMPFIPSGIFDLLITILFAVIIIVVVVKIYAMNQRDNLNFDELKLPPMPEENKYQENKAKVDAGNLLGAVQGEQCVGQNCCDSNATIWSDTRKTCYPKPYTDTTPNPDVNYIWKQENYDSVGTYIKRTDCTDPYLKVCNNVCINKNEDCISAFSCMNNQTPPFTPSEFSEYSLYK